MAISYIRVANHSGNAAELGPYRDLAAAQTAAAEWRQRFPDLVISCSPLSAPEDVDLHVEILREREVGIDEAVQRG